MSLTITRETIYIVPLPSGHVERLTEEEARALCRQLQDATGTALSDTETHERPPRGVRTPDPPRVPLKRPVAGWTTGAGVMVWDAEKRAQLRVLVREGLDRAAIVARTGLTYSQVCHGITKLAAHDANAQTQQTPTPAPAAPVPPAPPDLAATIREAQATNRTSGWVAARTGASLATVNRLWAEVGETARYRATVAAVARAGEGGAA